MDIQTMIDSVKTWFKAALPNIAGCIAVLVIGWWLASALSSLLRRAMNRSKADAGIVSFIYSFIKTALRVIVLITAAAQLGLNVTSIIAAVGAAGVTIGLALKDSFSNFASGAQIIFSKPFHVGNYISIDGVEGTVVRIEVLFTTLLTVDNKEVVIPNSHITQSTLINYSAQSTRRLDLSYLVRYDEDLKKVKDLIRDTAFDSDWVLSDPEPIIAAGAYKENGLSVDVKLWCSAENYLKLYYYMQEHVKPMFDAHDIEIPYSRLDVRIRQ